MKRLDVEKIINLQALINRTKAKRDAKAVIRDTLNSFINKLVEKRDRHNVDIETLDRVVEQMVQLGTPADCHRMRADSMILAMQNSTVFNKQLGRKVLGRARRIVSE